MRAGPVNHLPEQVGIFQHGAWPQMVFIEGLAIVVGHENGSLQAFQQRFFPDVRVRIMDKHAGVHVPVRVDVEIPAISLEGFEEATDGRRGEGVYQKVLQAMSILKEKKFWKSMAKRGLLARISRTR